MQTQKIIATQPQNSSPSVWRFGLWASLYQLTRTLAAEKHMLNVVSQASWVERSRAAATRLPTGLVAPRSPAHPMGTDRSQTRLLPTPR